MRKMLVVAAAALGLAILFVLPALSQPKLEHEQMLYPVVMVRTPSGTGSGTVIYSVKREEGGVHSYVLTNFHVISDAVRVAEEWDPKAGKKVEKERREPVRVEFFDYNNWSRSIGTRTKLAEVVGYDRQADLAVLRLADREHVVAPTAFLLPEDAPVYLFDQVFAVGAGLGKPPFPTVGVVANLDQTIDGYPYMLASAPIIFGNSGGALFRRSAERERYELVGVPSRVSAAGYGAAVTHMAWSIQTATIYAFLRANGLDFVVAAPAAAR